METSQGRTNRVYLQPNWNNEACSTCRNNHRAGYVVDECRFSYHGECFVELCNLAINERGRFNYSNEDAIDTIVSIFPELIYVRGRGGIYIREFDHQFSFYKNYTEQIYIRD